MKTQKKSGQATGTGVVRPRLYASGGTVEGRAFVIWAGR